MKLNSTSFIVVILLLSVIGDCGFVRALAINDKLVFNVVKTEGKAIDEPWTEQHKTTKVRSYRQIRLLSFKIPTTIARDSTGSSLLDLREDPSEIDSNQRDPLFLGTDSPNKSASKKLKSRGWNDYFGRWGGGKRDGGGGGGRGGDGGGGGKGGDGNGQGGGFGGGGGGGGGFGGGGGGGFGGGGGGGGGGGFGGGGGGFGGGGGGGGGGGFGGGDGGGGGGFGGGGGGGIPPPPKITPPNVPPKPKPGDPGNGNNPNGDNNGSGGPAGYSQPPAQNNVVKPVILAVAVCVAAAAMVALISARRRSRCNERNLRLPDTDSLGDGESSIETIDRPVSFMVNIKNAINGLGRLTVSQDAANITGQSKFTEFIT
ncbi:5720_t:CDS:2 [Paraglomus occultum]|uniref:5720_t:CDS:1 n=1 Tax=Paraglomus occultum TaxID=144539 RepID=A0A9N8VV53_9GLOM|nr:5720_t:CDS:2 [Paraglomus occultum]